MKTLFYKMILVYILLAAWLCIVNPSEAPLVLLFVPFVLVGLAVYYTLMVVLSKLASFKPSKKPHVHMTATISALLVVVVLSMQSIGQLSVRDIVVAGLVLALGYFYIGRNSQTS